MSSLEDIQRQDRLFPHPERLVPFLGNHDTTRFLNEPGATIADLKMGFALLATMRGMPQIYSGDEIAMHGGEDPDNRHDFPGGFPGDQASAFIPAQLTRDQSDVFDWASSLLQLRAKNWLLQTGQQQNLFADDSAWIFARTPDVRSGCTPGGSERVIIAVNHSDHPRDIVVPTRMTTLDGCATLKPELDAPQASSSNNGDLKLSLGAKSTAIYVAAR